MSKDPYDMTIDLVCPIQTRLLKHIRQFIVHLVCDIGFSDKEVQLIEMAVDEACSNIIAHAYKNFNNIEESQKKVYMKIEVLNKRIKITVGDKGKGMLPHQIHRQQNLQQYVLSQTPHGLGTYIITNFMDEVLFHSQSGEGTKIEMSKYCRNNNGNRQKGGE